MGGRRSARRKGFRRGRGRESEGEGALIRFHANDVVNLYEETLGRRS